MYNSTMQVISNKMAFLRLASDEENSCNWCNSWTKRIIHGYEVVLLFIFPVMAFGQDKDFEKVPKQISFETGYRYIFSSTFANKASSGTGFLFDYAWKLSGFENKKAVFISVPLGYYFMAKDNENHQNMRILSYGWTIRHELSKNKKVIPFMGYALLLNQLSIENTEGQVFGHQTKFAFGVNFLTLKKADPFVKVEYSYTRYPSLGVKKSNSMNTFEIKAGLRVNKNAK